MGSGGNPDEHLEAFFYLPLHEISTVTYRHEVFRDLKRDDVRAADRSVRDGRCAPCGERLDRARQLWHRLQKQGWFVYAVQAFCDAAVTLRDESRPAPGRREGCANSPTMWPLTSMANDFRVLVAETGNVQAELRRDPLLRAHRGVKGARRNGMPANPITARHRRDVRTVRLGTGQRLSRADQGLRRHEPCRRAGPGVRRQAAPGAVQAARRSSARSTGATWIPPSPGSTARWLLPGRISRFIRPNHRCRVEHSAHPCITDDPGCNMVPRTPSTSHWRSRQYEMAIRWCATTFASRELSGSL